jgi:hypothetical protein
MPLHTAKTEKCDTSTTIAHKLAHKSTINYLELRKAGVWQRKDSNSFMSVRPFLASFSFSSYARFVKGCASVYFLFLLRYTWLSPRSVTRYNAT